MNKRLVLRLFGYLFSVVPPALAILERFPLFSRAGGEFVLSGLGFLLLLVAAIPLRRGAERLLRRALASPSAPGVWAVLWLFCAWFGHISRAIAEVAMIGTLSSLIGAVFFRLGRGEAEEDED